MPIVGASFAVAAEQLADALAYLTELTHRRTRTWIHDVEQLHELLQAYGEAALRAASSPVCAASAVKHTPAKSILGKWVAKAASSFRPH